MSVEYGISAILEAVYNKENIEGVLKNGLNMGVCYYEEDLDTPISIDKIITKIIFANPNNEFHCVDIQYKDAYVDLCFFNKEGELSVMLSGLSSSWSRKYSKCYRKCEDVDIDRYMQLFFKLIDGFKLQELRVEKS